MKFAKRRIQSVAARRIYKTYWKEVDWLCGLGSPRSIDADGIAPLHGLGWSAVEQRVLGGRLDDLMSPDDAARIEQRFLASLCERFGVPVFDLQEYWHQQYNRDHPEAVPGSSSSGDDRIPPE